VKYKKHPHTKDGWTEWYRPAMRNYRMSCCDCGLVHEVQFKVDGKELHMRVRRNERATAAVRRREHDCGPKQKLKKDTTKETKKACKYSMAPRGSKTETTK
jgi:hypothetical protein